MGRRFGIVFGTSLAVVAMVPQNAVGVTIGEDMTTPGNTIVGCGPTLTVSCTYFNGAVPERQVAAPFDGILTVWRVRGASATGSMRIHVLRPTGGGAFTAVETGQYETVPPIGVSTFPASLPVRQGDLVALDVPGAPGTPSVQRRSPFPGGAFGDYIPAIAPGATDGSYSTILNQTVLYNADVEPDADGDGFGDETQDRCPTDAAKQAECVPPETAFNDVPDDKTRKKRATFVFSGSDARAVVGFECSLDDGAFASCATPHTVKVRTGKHTFAVRAIDAAGNADPTPASDAWTAKVRKKKRH